jgi:hypothetical protein
MFSASNNGQKEGIVRFTLGYSGGAVPVSHRSSLFVGVFSNNADHQRTE